MSKHSNRHPEALDDRIARAFNDGATSVSVSHLIEEADPAMASANEAAIRAKEHALNSALSRPDALSARGEAEAAAFLRDCLERTHEKTLGDVRDLDGNPTMPMGLMPHRRIGRARSYNVFSEADVTVVIRNVTADEIVASYCTSLTVEEFGRRRRLQLQRGRRAQRLPAICRSRARDATQAHHPLRRLWPSTECSALAICGKVLT